MVTEEITNDYDKRWLCYVGAVLSVFSGDLLPTTRSNEGSVPLYVPREALKGYLHLGDCWFEVQVTDRQAVIDWLRAKHFAAKDRQEARKFDANQNNTFSSLMKALEISKTSDPRG
jgi:hypothetical protein